MTYRTSIWNLLLLLLLWMLGTMSACALIYLDHGSAPALSAPRRTRPPELR